MTARATAGTTAWPICRIRFSASVPAAAAARKALPNGILLSGPKPVIYPGRGERPGASAKLAWLVELRDDVIPARNLYVVDAIEGTIRDVLDRIYEARNRRTYDANHGSILPGALARSEGQGPTGDRDVDNAHDFAGATYDDVTSGAPTGATVTTTVVRRLSPLPTMAVPVRMPTGMVRGRSTVTTSR